MYWRRAAALILTTTATIQGTAAKLITITENVSACSAVYTSASRSVTVVRSTVTVSPVPWIDDAPNSGTPFVLGIGGGFSDSKKRAEQQALYITPQGHLTTDASLAAHYVIQDGKLTTTNGGHMSTANGVRSQLFAFSNVIKPIQKSFMVKDLGLEWHNTEFDGGMAHLYRDGNNVMALFKGAKPAGWTSIMPSARPVSQATSGGSGAHTSSILISTAISIGSMPHGPSSTHKTSTVKASSSSKLSTIKPASSSSKHSSVKPASSSKSSSVKPASSSPVSPSGMCGPGSGFSCSGGQCCSSYGYCGMGETYCGTGCQHGYGACSVQSSSGKSGATSTSPKSSSSSPKGQMSMSMPMSMPSSSKANSASSMPKSTTSMKMASASTMASSPSPMPSFVCPDDNGKTVTDLENVEYTLGCRQDTTQGAYGSAFVMESFDECFALCDAEEHCTAFTYIGGPDGIGNGTCFFKDEGSEFVNHGNNLVGAIRLSPFSGSPAVSSSSSKVAHPASTYTATGTPIGGDIPGPSPTMSSMSSSSISKSMPMSMPMGSSTTTPSSSSMSMPGMSSTKSSAMPSSTVPVSPNGHCGIQGNGGTPDGFTCSGSAFGMCCSNSGFCGNTTEYCLAGCQSAYGSCTVQTGNPITVSGHCGLTAGNQTCTGGIFGACCSTSGFCGSTGDYCEPGSCDPMFGTCNKASSSIMQMSSTSLSMSMPMSTITMSSRPISTSSSQMMSSSTSMSSSSSMMSSSKSISSSSSMMMSSGSSQSSFSSSSTSSRASSSSVSSSTMAVTTTSSSSRTSSTMAMTSSSATPTYTPTPYNPTCSAYNGTGYTDSMGNTYVILCDRNTDPGAFASSIEPDFAACITACGGYSSPACVAVTYVGGTCYFKSGYSGDPSSPGTNAAVLASVLGQAPMSYNPSTPTSTSSSRTSSATSSTGSTITSSPTSSSTMISSSTTSTSTSTGPYLILTSPTPCDFGDPADYDEDDSYCEIDLPFAMHIYAQSSTQSYASTNGYLSIQEGSSQYEAQAFPTDNLPNNTVAPFFDDLYLYGGQSPTQGIFYQFNSANTTVSYEYYLQRAGNNGAPYHFVIAYDSAVPGVFTYTYYSVGGSSDLGLYAAVGMQGIDGTSAESGFTYSYQSQDILPGLVVSCNTLTNACVTTTPGSAGR